MGHEPTFTLPPVGVPDFALHGTLNRHLALYFADEYNFDQLAAETVWEIDLYAAVNVAEAESRVCAQMLVDAPLWLPRSLDRKLPKLVEAAASHLDNPTTRNDFAANTLQAFPVENVDDLAFAVLRGLLGFYSAAVYGASFLTGHSLSEVHETVQYVSFQMLPHPEQN